MIPHTGFHGLAAVLALFASAISPSLAAVVKSRLFPGVQVDYKETHICETTPGVRSYAGYITLPPTLDPLSAPYTNHLFFWFFEARHAPVTAPLTVWLQGGPGAASADQAVSGANGPCIANRDSKTTRLNPHSWTGASHMLYVDQPSQVGFSFDGDAARDGYVNMVTGIVDTGKGWDGRPTNWTMLKGRFASQQPGTMANTTMGSARAVYWFLQAWFEEFQQYRRDEVSIWSQSYGGHYGPALASIILAEKNGTGPLATQAKCSSSALHKFGVATLGVFDGWFDILQQGPSFPRFALNNTYGIEIYNVSIAAAAKAAMEAPKVGCGALVENCRALAAQGDPLGLGGNTTVAQACGGAFTACWVGVYGPYEMYSGRNPFDIGHLLPDPFPPAYSIGYLNQPEVLEALGAKVNYTEATLAVTAEFFAVGDFLRGGFLEQIGALIDQGVAVSLIHGDRDFKCNWFGGESISLAVPFADKAGFAAAGYTNITAPSSAGAAAGMVRQYGHFSFSRIFEAGHEVPLFQPAAAYALFTRTLAGRDLATGTVPVSGLPGGAAQHQVYSTQGQRNIDGVRRTQPPPQPKPECYVMAAPLPKTCSDAQILALWKGEAVVEDLFVVKPER